MFVFIISSKMIKSGLEDCDWVNSKIMKHHFGKPQRNTTKHQRFISNTD